MRSPSPSDPLLTNFVVRVAFSLLLYLIPVAAFVSMASRKKPRVTILMATVMGGAVGGALQYVPWMLKGAFDLNPAYVMSQFALSGAATSAVIGLLGLAALALVARAKQRA